MCIMSRIIRDDEILDYLDELLMNIESDDEFMDDIELCVTIIVIRPCL